MQRPSRARSASCRARVPDRVSIPGSRHSWSLFGFFFGAIQFGPALTRQKPLAGAFRQGVRGERAHSARAAMAETFADHFAESAARTNALRRSHRELRSTRERAARTRQSLAQVEPPSPAGMHPETLTQMGRGDAEGVTEEDEMNARLASEMGQLERWKKRRESSAGTGDGDRLSPIVRDALREALRVERNCERLFSVFNPSTPGDAFAVSPEGTPRFSQGGGVRHVASRPALVDLEARESLAP